MIKVPTDILTRNGWQTATNNIHGLPGVELVPAGPGALQPATFDLSVWFIGTGFVILRTKAVRRPNSDFVRYEHDAVIGFKTEAALVAWLTKHGKRSDGGQAGQPAEWD